MYSYLLFLWSGTLWFWQPIFCNYNRNVQEGSGFVIQDYGSTVILKKRIIFSFQVDFFVCRTWAGGPADMGQDRNSRTATLTDRQISTRQGRTATLIDRRTSTAQGRSAPLTGRRASTAQGSSAPLIGGGRASTRQGSSAPLKGGRASTAQGSSAPLMGGRASTALGSSWIAIQIHCEAAPWIPLLETRNDRNTIFFSIIFSFSEHFGL